MTFDEKLEFIKQELIDNAHSEGPDDEDCSGLETDSGHGNCRGCSLDFLLDAIEKVQSWSEQRIKQCRADEQKFNASPIAIEAARERMTLEAVLVLLKGVERD